MLRHLVLAATLLFSSAAFAQQTNVSNFDKLTPVQQQEILQAVQQKASENGFDAKKETPVVENTKGVLAYVAESGEAIGKGIGAIAKEVGVVVTDFLNTPVGMLAVGLLVWQVIGGDIVQMFTGIFLFTGGNFIILPLMYRWMSDRIDELEYTVHPWFGLVAPQVRKKIVYRITDGEWLFFFIIIACCINFAGVIALVTL